MKITTQDYGQFLINSDNGKLKQDFQAKLKVCSLKMKLFRLMVHSNRTDFILTNDNEAICIPEDATKACAFRCKIEHYHREVKQVTGIAKCQARNTKAERKYIIISILAWIILHSQAFLQNINIYELKNKPLKTF